MRRVFLVTAILLSGDLNDTTASPERCRMGVKISHGFYTEMPQEIDIKRGQETCWRSFLRTSRLRESRIEKRNLMLDHVHMLI